ncbi:MAG: sulfatase-like hydrolase/transferase [Candidatus Poribacteria bacterium]
MSQKMNILLFMPEQLRADAVDAITENGAKTPNMAQIGAEGVIFSNCFVQHTVCTPSRCSMFTGLYPHSHAHRTLTYLLRPHERNLFRELKENGYYVQCFGKNDILSQESLSLGFNSVQLRVKPEHRDINPWAKDHKHRKSFYYGSRENAKDGDWAIIQSALNFLDDDRDQPFCLFLPMSFSHPPYIVEEPYFSMYDRSKMPKPIPAKYDDKRRFMKMIHESYGLNKLDETDFREIKATYYGMTSRIDDQLGLLCNKLKSIGKYDNTAIFVFSDHGDYTGDYALTEKWWTGFQDCLIHTPFMAKVPGYNPVGRKDTFIEMVDLFPTILDIAGIEPKHYHFGKNLMPMIKGEASHHRDCVFAEGGHLPDEIHCYEPLIEGIYYDKVRLPLRDPKVFSKAVMVRNERYKYIYCPDDMDELYDLVSDPQEINNIANNPSMENVMRELRDKIAGWLLRSSDSPPLEWDKRGW